ncbi:hypothetical protein BU17DRAFT_65464 [Hysterangium stoloniferum]|nr:hypothetical protein BU17DRAFT_65464 [Hysterangium stoloniferum]
MSSTANYTVTGNIITLHCSDGDKTFRPSLEELTLVVLKGGLIDYMHECTRDSPTLKLWKTKIGSFLAQHVLKLPDARRRKYILSSLPRDYGLFDHRKGDRYNPRHDAYLYGSKVGAVFRSPAEFFFHAKWILLGCPTPGSVPGHNEELWGPALPEEITDRCACTYCAGTSQEYISMNFSNYKPSKRAHKEEASDRIHVRFEGN